MDHLNTIHQYEYHRIANDLNKNIHSFLDEVKGHVAVIEEEIIQLETLDLGMQINNLIENAYQRILKLK